MRELICLALALALASVEAAVFAAEKVSLEGEIVDFSCFVRMGAKGEGHKECAEKCVKQGLPAGIATPDGKAYVFLSAAAHFAPVVGLKARLSGTLFRDFGGIAPEKLQVERKGKWEDFALPKPMM